MKPSLSVSLKVYLGLMAFLVAIKLVLTYFPQVFRSPAQAAATPRGVTVSRYRRVSMQALWSGTPRTAR